jgi:hypothetical protein
MEKHLSFHYLYMQRLSQALHTQLGEVQLGDPRGLAACADRMCMPLLGAWCQWRTGKMARRQWLQSNRLPGVAEASSADEAPAEAASKRQRPRPWPGLPPLILPGRTWQG